MVLHDGYFCDAEVWFVDTERQTFSVKYWNPETGYEAHMLNIPFSKFRKK